MAYGEGKYSVGKYQQSVPTPPDEPNYTDGAQGEDTLYADVTNSDVVDWVDLEPTAETWETITPPADDWVTINNEDSNTWTPV